MDTNTELWIGVGATGLLALAAFAAYRWWQRRRIDRVERWVKDYLVVRYGQVPGSLSIHCSEDQAWPVLVAFRSPGTGVRHSLQFSCGACPPGTLVSETEESRHHDRAARPDGPPTMPPAAEINLLPKGEACSQSR